MPLNSRSIVRRVSQTVFLLFALSSVAACEKKLETVEVQFKNADGTTSPKISAEVVDTNSERQMGMMYRKEMAETSGMLFVFPEEQLRSFWMRNTYVELDIVFLDKDLKVVSIAERATPLSEKSRPSMKPAQFALEILGGQSAKWGVQPGSQLEIHGERPIARS
jgi:uncharacterized protein